VNDLERKVAWLTAVEHIRNVIARYALAGDNKNDPQAMRMLLTENARWEARGFGKFEGRDNIAVGLGRIAEERILWSLHFPVAPIIDVGRDLDRAHAFWWLWELTTMREADGTERNHWLGATYECDFVREPDGWKIHDLVLDVKTIVPYEAAPPATGAKPDKRSRKAKKKEKSSKDGKAKERRKGGRQGGKGRKNR
jgi:hypothetical protein